jgi:hypothetical protein
MTLKSDTNPPSDWQQSQWALEGRCAKCGADDDMRHQHQCPNISNEQLIHDMIKGEMDREMIAKFIMKAQESGFGGND